MHTHRFRVLFSVHALTVGGQIPYTYMHVTFLNSIALNFSHTHSLTHSLSHSLTHSLSLSLSLSLPHTHTPSTSSSPSSP